jgi:DNA-binding PadR family transcriptional regulator
VGRGGAGPHDLRRNAEQGRVNWDAAPSQWYSEPKRLAKLGYLDSRKEPGKARPRTHYTITAKGLAALEKWVRTPAPLPRMQHESVVRLLSADLVPPQAVAQGLPAMRAEIETALRHLDQARKRWSQTLPHRVDLLSVNNRYAECLLRLQLEWLDEAERVLAKRSSGA